MVLKINVYKSLDVIYTVSFVLIMLRIYLLENGYNAFSAKDPAPKQRVYFKGKS